MTAQNQTSFSFPGFGSREIRTQYSALCYRLVQNKPQVLLITSRGTGRWILPKGWPMKGRSPGEAALQEAYEEAGVSGRVSEVPLGVYRYLKLMDDGRGVPCVGLVYPVRVTRLAKDFPEADERRRKWYSRKKAAKKVDEPELARLIRGFKPRAGG